MAQFMGAFPDGTATVCISNPSVSSQTVMEYWNGGSGSWVAGDAPPPGIAEFSTNPPNTICGDMPVASLSGTPIAIGPLTSTTPTVHLVTTVQSVTLNPTAGQYLAAVTVTNDGGEEAGNVTITAASLNGAQPATTVPVVIGNLGYSGSATVVLAFPSSAGAQRTPAVLEVRDSYSGGSAGGGFRVVLP